VEAGTVGPDPVPPTDPRPGLSLFVLGVLDLRAAVRRGPMFAEFAERISDGLLQLSLTRPLAEHGARRSKLWRAAFVLAEGRDLEPLEGLMRQAMEDPLVREGLVANLHHIAWTFDLGAPPCDFDTRALVRIFDRAGHGPPPPATEPNPRPVDDESENTRKLD